MESKFHWKRMRNLQRGIQNPRHFWIAFLQEAINQPKHIWFCVLKTFLHDQNSKEITDENKYWTMLEMQDLIGCWKVLNLMAGIQGSPSYLSNDYNHNHHAKTGSNNFRCRCCIAHPYFLAKRKKPKKDKQTKRVVVRENRAKC